MRRLQVAPLSTLTMLALTSFLAVPGTAVDEPFVATFVSQGRIACALGFWSFATIDQCGEHRLDPNAKSQFQIAAPAGQVTGAVYEVEWTPASPFGARCLGLHYPPVFPANTTFTTDDRTGPGGGVSGTSPVGITIEAPDVADPLYAIDGGVLLFEVRPSGATSNEILEDPLGVCQAGLVLQQDFTFYVSLFYFGAPVPPGFTHLV